MMAHAKLTIGNEESFDSNGSIYTAGSKRLRVEKYKGVVLQNNGHWGAQIYADQQRVWLGTFKSEVDAATAYDSAAIKLHKEDSHRNFQWTSISSQEPKFQSHFTTDAILNMIRDGSYHSKFVNFLRIQQSETSDGQAGRVAAYSSSSAYSDFRCTLLFEKELTPSDVGKLNRLVIPKRFAVKHFPNVPETPEDPALESERSVDEVQLEFFDRNMKLWKFRYCYWKSSQSFVFTRGWNRFVKDKGLRASDTISFYLYEGQSAEHFGQSFIVIDVAQKQAAGRVATSLGRNFVGVSDGEIGREMLARAVGLARSNKRIRLFGVNVQV